jgi:methylenetetrahydrofolate reductase (NADPH)
MSSLGVSALLLKAGYDVVMQMSCRDRNRIALQADLLAALRTAGIMRDQGVFLSGRRIAVPPALFLGAVENPFAPPLDWRAERLAKKIEAGAEFIQTQYVFDVEVFREFMTHVRDLGLLERVYILAGVGPLKSPKAAEFMRSRVPGVVIPDSFIERLSKTPRERWRAEGIQICSEIIERVREIEGVAGIHIMAYRQEAAVSEIIQSVGLSPRMSSAEVGAG